MKKLLKKFIPDFILYWYHWKLAFWAAMIYGWPSRKIKVIGVTGTKGKSTVVMLAGKVLQEKFSLRQAQGKLSSNNKPVVGWISSLTINNGKEEKMNPYHMTMPGRFFIQKTLRQMVKNGCEYALVEVTSEGIKQYRHRFIKWAGAVFTNLAPEHLEAHGGFENYRAAKEKLFAATAKNKKSFGVYNLDDASAGHFESYAIKNKFGYSQKKNFQFPVFNFQTIFRILDIHLKVSGSQFKINGVDFKTNLLGEFNVLNCAAAAAIGAACGAALENAAQALLKIKSIPGRLEIINEGQDFIVAVDLAHTPDSYEKVFKLFKDLLVSQASARQSEGGPHQRIISVFGSAGGGRDKWKRPELGKIASQYSDQVFITNEDPYEEEPLAIANDILTGCDKNKTDIVLDRRAAVARGLSLAREGDIVLILGKGTEQTYNEGGKKINWDDRNVVREEIRKILK